MVWKEDPSKFVRLRKPFKDLNWVQRNPRIAFGLVTFFTIGVYFVKPIYDRFDEDHIVLTLEEARDPEIRKLITGGRR